MKELKLWYLRNFKVISTNKVLELNLIFCHNIYGDGINMLNCRSIWRDYKDRRYRVEELVN